MTHIKQLAQSIKITQHFYKKNIETPPFSYWSYYKVKEFLTHKPLLR